jgi:hypothetical protein
MKNAFKFLIPMLIVVLSACKKDGAAKEEDLTEKDLTECPSGANCIFSFANNAGMEGTRLTLSTGQYRVFWAYTSIKEVSFSLYMMAPMVGDRFILNDEDFKAGRVKFINNCASCYSIGLTPVEGTVKGQRVSATAGGKERWLVEVDIVMGSNADPNYHLPIHLKQYYVVAN